MTFGLCNPEYYRGAILEIRKSMEVREEGMEVQEESAVNFYNNVQAMERAASSCTP